MPDLLDAFLAFALALVVVWISTPVVKAMAWRIGAIDEPRERGLHQFPTPRLGGLAILAGVLASGLCSCRTTSRPRDPDRRRGDRRGGSRRRPARPVRGREARRPGAGGGRPGRRGRARRDDDAPVRRPPRPRRHVVSADGDRHRRGDEHRQLHRRGRRAGRGRLHDRRAHVRGDRAVAGPQRRGRAGDADRGRVARLPAPRVPPRLDLPRRLRAPTCSATCWRRSRCRAP